MTNLDTIHAQILVCLFISFLFRMAPLDITPFYALDKNVIFFLLFRLTI